jgi:hypothetical protein
MVSNETVGRTTATNSSCEEEGPRGVVTTMGGAAFTKHLHSSQSQPGRARSPAFGATWVAQHAFFTGGVTEQQLPSPQQEEVTFCTTGASQQQLARTAAGQTLAQTTTSVVSQAKVERCGRRNMDAVQSRWQSGRYKHSQNGPPRQSTSRVDRLFNPARPGKLPPQIPADEGLTANAPTAGIPMQFATARLQCVLSHRAVATAAPRRLSVMAPR